MPVISQKDRMLQITTPLGPDELLLTGFRGQDAMSRPFVFELALVSLDHAIPFEKIVGKNVTISVTLADTKKKRFFNGFVRSFSQAGGARQQDKEIHLAEYRATVVSWLWFLSLTENSKIFQDKSVPDIVEDVFKFRGFQDYALRLHGTYDKRVYCVQYRESDYQFMSRLLEDEGIFYFFEHENGKHTLVLADDPSEIKACPQQSSARFAGSVGEWKDEDRIQEFQKRVEVMPTKVTLNDYNFEVPNGNLKVDVPISKKLTDRDCEVYDYPGGYDKRTGGDRLANIRMQEEEARVAVFTGAGDCRAFTSGQKFELKEFKRPDMADKEYVLTQITHEAMQTVALSGAKGAPANYRNQFTCFSADVPFRPLRETPRPVVRGTQTAVVAGPSGEEIHTDEHGRIKVQFHWDRDGKKDDKSSCWIRVGQVWSGPGWGGVFIPRIGQEVIVDFLEGDPDRPIVIGAVYNGANKPPYPLPDEKTKSTVKSDCTIGGGGFNEIRFEDKKGSEEIFVHGQKDWTIAILNDKNQTVGHDETLTVGNNRMKKVGVNESVAVGANRTESIGANESLTVGANKAETVAVASAETVGAGKALTVGAGYQIAVGAAMNTTVGGAMAEEVGAIKSVAVAGNMTENIGGDKSSTVGKNETMNVGKNFSIVADEKATITAEKDLAVQGKNVTIVGKEQIGITCGDASITLKKDGGIVIKGKDITLTASGKVNVTASGNVKIKGSSIGMN